MFEIERESIRKIGNDPGQLENDIGQAVRSFTFQGGETRHTVSTPQPHWQHLLTFQIIEYRNSLFTETLSDADRDRLLSLQTLYAMSWTQEPNP